MEKAKKTSQLSKIVLSGILILTAVIFMMPLVYVVLGSFKHVEEIYTTRPTLLPEYGVHLGGYQTLIKQMPILRNMLNSAIVAGTGTILSVFFCSLAGFGFSKFRFAGREILFYVVLGSMMIPFYGVVIPLFIIIRSFGWADTYQALILPWVALAFGIFLMRQYIAGVPDELIDAARMDGASNFGIYYKVVIPLTKPGLIVFGFIKFLFFWSFLFWPLIVISKEEMGTLPYALANVFASGHEDVIGCTTFDWTSVLSAATIAMLPALIIFFIFQKYIVSGIMGGSIR